MAKEKVISWDLHLSDVGLDAGRGSTEYYQYWFSGIRLNTKKNVLEALNLGMKVMRKDKLTGKVEQFSHTTKSWENKD